MKIYFMAEDEFPLMLDTENKTIQFLDSYAERQILRENEKRITNHILNVKRADVFRIANSHQKIGYRWVLAE
jgi:hypothetical protein